MGDPGADSSPLRDAKEKQLDPNDFVAARETRHGRAETTALRHRSFITLSAVIETVGGRKRELETGGRREGESFPRLTAAVRHESPDDRNDSGNDGDRRTKGRKFALARELSRRNLVVLHRRKYPPGNE